MDRPTKRGEGREDRLHLQRCRCADAATQKCSRQPWHIQHVGTPLVCNQRAVHKGKPSEHITGNVQQVSEKHVLTVIADGSFGWSIVSGK